MNYDFLALVGEYHRNLPDRIIDYLHARGISDDVITLHRLGWNGQRITIPVFSRDGALAGFKLAKDPEDTTDSPKMLTSRGSSLELYGWERVLARPSRLVICEGEFDRLVLETHGVAAVTPTAGAGSFRAEWAADLATVPELYVCFDRDEAGRSGAFRVGQFVPHARIVELPEDVGPGGDVTDFFVRLGRSREEFFALLGAATPVPVPPATLPVHHTTLPVSSDGLSHQIADIKRSVPIADVVSRYVPLRPSGLSLRGLCPFHDDHNPSLMVYAESGRFQCFGCGQRGDVIAFLMAVEQLPFLRALDALARFQSDDHGHPSAQL